MIALKDIDEVIEYNYRVCEEYSCELESDSFYEREDRNIDLCSEHYRQLSNYGYL